MITATFELADFGKLSNVYVSSVQEGNIYAEVKLMGENNKYVDFLRVGKVDGRKLGSKQEARARALQKELLQRVTSAVQAAGWTVSYLDSLGITSYKRNANLQNSVTPESAMHDEKPVGNGVKQDSVTPTSARVLPEKAVPVASVPPVVTAISEQTGNKQQITVGTYTRTVQAKSITFVCAHCGQTVTQERYPGPKLMYCSTCKPIVEKEQTRLRVQRLRAGKKAASQG